VTFDAGGIHWHGSMGAPVGFLADTFYIG
jgi:hypothetical protein